MHMYMINNKSTSACGLHADPRITKKQFRVASYMFSQSFAVVGPLTELGLSDVSVAPPTGTK